MAFMRKRRDKICVSELMEKTFEYYWTEISQYSETTRKKVKNHSIVFLYQLPKSLNTNGSENILKKL